MKILNYLFSFKTTILLLSLLAIGAAIATFIENDFGTSSARVLVYNNLWYEIVFLLTIINLFGIIYKYKMWRNKARFILHLSFAVILLGAGITRYMGYEGIIQIKEGSTENKMISLEPYLQIKIVDKNDKNFYVEEKKEFSSFLKFVNSFNLNVKFNNRSLEIKYKDFISQKKGTSKEGLFHLNLTLGNETKDIILRGNRGQIGSQKVVEFKDVIVLLEYGSKILQLPFSIKLNDFQLDRYPGSMSPSSYASEVTVLRKDNSSYNYRIFMNKTLSEGNFLFFQSSYFPDESGTVLSVNNDPGKWSTYSGYFLLTIGLLLNFFDKNSRFAKLTTFIKGRHLASIIFLLPLFFTNNLHANQVINPSYQVNPLDAYLSDFKEDSKTIAEKFSKIVTQSNDGRMQPLSTLNKNIVLKLSSKFSLFGLTSDQVVLGILTRPDIWKQMKIIKIKTPKLKNFLGIKLNRKYISFKEVFKDGKYILNNEVQKASIKKPINRGTYEKDILKVDERLNIFYATFNGNLFNIIPKKNNVNTKWHKPLDAIKTFENKDEVELIIKNFVTAVGDFRWNTANNYLNELISYQKINGSEIIPSKLKIDNEIFFNNLNIFYKLTISYMIIGFIMLIIAFVTIFNPKIYSKRVVFFFNIAVLLLFLMHTFGMGFRWLISGHAPWSDTYESLLYISWSAVFAGFVFFRKSLLALSAAILVAGIFMFTANLTGIDPQITNLVPVLKSYWLTIHVSVLTASYGFFGLSAILGFMTLILFIFRKNKKHIDETIITITAINEISLIIGLAAITIGNFLGAIWANESWGRYWGWDPKETWAYISIIVYAIIVHLRFIKSFSTPFVFAIASLLSFSTILMTYLGVNFYLSGMHSYATGDPVPIPNWAYYFIAIILVTILFSYKNKDLKKKIESNG